MSLPYNIINPAVIWDDGTHWIVSKKADPQESAKPIALFPKDDPESKVNAKLFLKLWRKYQGYEKILKPAS